MIEQHKDSLLRNQLEVFDASIALVLMLRVGSKMLYFCAHYGNGVPGLAAYFECFSQFSAPKNTPKEKYFWMNEVGRG